jgi:hypothetical protein
MCIADLVTDHLQIFYSAKHTNNINEILQRRQGFSKRSRCVHFQSEGEEEIGNRPGDSIFDVKRLLVAEIVGEGDAGRVAMALDLGREEGASPGDDADLAAGGGGGAARAEEGGRAGRERSEEAGLDRGSVEMLGHGGERGGRELEFSASG